jgi:predicted esterase
MIERAPQGPATAGLVLLHGRGGSAEDILPLADMAQVPGLAALAPQAPGHSWWPTSFLAAAAETAPHLARALAAVEEAVARLRAHLPPERIWLAGFSQGACLALEAFARRGGGLAGVLAFSGGLLGTSDAAETGVEALYGHRPKRFEYQGPLAGRIWLSVHERDPHIPRARVEESARHLAALGAQVETRLHPGAGHAVMPADLAALRRLLAS